MYGGILLMAMVALVMLSPLIWVAWWLVADLGERVSGRPATTPYHRPAHDLPRAA